MNSYLSPYAKGLLIAALSVLILSPDGLLTRLIGTDAWTLAFWRGLLSGLAICGALFALHGRQGSGHLRALGKPGLLVALALGLGSVTFAYSFTHTTIANALFLVNTSPVFTALIGWYALQDEVPMRTRLTIGAVLGGIAIITLSEGMDTGNTVIPASHDTAGKSMEEILQALQEASMAFGEGTKAHFSRQGESG